MYNIHIVPISYIYSDATTQGLPLSMWLPSSFGMIGNPIIQEHNKNGVKKTPSAQ